MTVLESEAEKILIRIKQHIMYKVKKKAKAEAVAKIQGEVIFKAEATIKEEETIKEEVIFKAEEIIIKVEDNLKTKVKVEAEAVSRKRKRLKSSCVSKMQQNWPLCCRLSHIYQ